MIIEQKSILTVDQLPDDPLKMPPPYWRGSGAIFHIQDSLQELLVLLNRLIPIHTKTEIQLEAYFQKYPTSDENEEALDEFADISSEL